jgi:hypothetical protein
MVIAALCLNWLLLFKNCSANKRGIHTKRDPFSNRLFYVRTKVHTGENVFRWTSCGSLRSDRRRQRRFVCRVAGVIAVFAFSIGVLPGEEQNAQFEVPKKDSAKAEALANQLALLSRRVDRNEAKLLADCAFATVARLRQEYRMFGTPIFNNFLVYHGFRKRGYCYQWSADLLVALDALKLKTLELHWGESHAGTWMENNCLVVTAKGQPFDRGMILDCWRHFGHLRWNLVPSDQDRYYENTKYAQFVRTRAASKASGTNHGVAFQTRVAPRGKPGD